MAKTIATILGIVFILVGLIGFAAPGLLGAHLSTAHNIVHLVSGAISLYLGLMGSLSAVDERCCRPMPGFIFGAVYLLLGVAGFALGTGADRMLDVIPGSLMLGTMDHIIHIALGAIFLIGAFMTSVAAAPAASE